MSEQDIRNMRKLDELAEKAGGYVAYGKSGEEVHYDYKKIYQYCKEKNIEPMDMTLRELQQFIVHS